MGKSRKITNDILEAGFGDAPPFLEKVRKGRGSKRAGQLFEEKVHKRLKKELGPVYVKGPWLWYVEAGQKKRFCQPDGLVVDAKAGVVIIVECKLTHTADAWNQMVHLYKPVLEKIFEGDFWEFRGVEVFKFMNAHTPYPEKIEVVSDLLKANSGFGNVRRMDL